MKSPRQPNRRSHRRRSFALIDVVAALALFSGAIVGLLSAQSRALQQLAASDRQRQAAHLAEELLAVWSLERQDVTRPNEGIFAGPAGWSWRRTAESTTAVGDVELTTIQLEILRTDERGQVQIVARFVWLELPDVAPYADRQP